MYFVAQLFGAIVGAAVLYSSTGEQFSDYHLCTPVPADMSAMEVFGFELVITFVLVLTYFASADIGRLETEGFRTLGPLAIGISVAMCHLWAVRSGRMLCRSWFILVFVFLALLIFLLKWPCLPGFCVLNAARTPLTPKMSFFAFVRLCYKS